MLDQLQYKQSVVRIQSPLAKWIRLLSPLYQRFVPASIRFRKNYKLAKLSDVNLLALLCWQVELGITVQRRFYRQLLNLGFSSLPERSRFCRLSVRAGQILQSIRNGLVKTVMSKPRYTIIDSFPMPVCHPIRNYRAKRFKPIANIGFNATKKQWYCGFKGSFEVTDQGIPVAYTITPTSVHDIKMVKTLVDQYPCSYILADVGYLSRKLKSGLADDGIDFWTPKRRNMLHNGVNNQLLMRDRRYIETVFSQWGDSFSLESNRAHSLDGFQTRIEQCLLVATLKKIN
ncbi:IS982 family transposase [Secundilactobacillus hailunensis]|uniref:IS982 family transposase n=1 Tax=Secundilactobacillus hailunensis TaxID=2559923 RepID=A0ABW1T767_9LACO|nr:IS982 family transposase [Secundilactobacillus hailunensis]